MHARMLLPALFLVLLPILVIPRSKSLGVVTMVIALWAALCAGFLRYPSPDGSSSKGCRMPCGPRPGSDP
jgi:arabinofuranosyltransferase